MTYRAISGHVTIVHDTTPGSIYMAASLEDIALRKVYSGDGHFE